MGCKIIQTHYQTDDNYALSGTDYVAETALARIIIASATGVPQGFYRKFAEHAAAQGFTVSTFDYRGIGQSAPTALRNFELDYRDWARRDLKAVIDHHGVGQVPIFLIGHSYGGHAIGLIDNHHKVQAAYCVGVGSGWHGWMPTMEKYRVMFMWNVVAPVITRLKGYLAWSRLGMGEDLPLGVYKQWKRWCKNPHYFFDDPNFPEVHQLFAQVKMPIKAVVATDDLWAMPRSRDAFFKHFTNATIDRIDIDPASINMPQVGHMGYFRAAAEPLWHDIHEYFKTHLDAA
ncbi:alpha/beta fold hydrolase [Alteromonas flava]|uniref:alpha/beta hydrolase family protein n=1 Tax=Alteromonas flava TaxID=2048003 RepID=UPI000C28F91A|nr:alpha/beta fold hydrolase [Alteromonas flava]